MDLMRTLLIYMSATMTLAVQSTAAPKVTPTPAPMSAETAIVETAVTPGPGSEAPAAAVPAAAAQPTEKITPAPVPTITPNTRAYHNLTMGAKGKEVKKLQEALIEKGYLPEGSADGAYGRQTYNAVKKFQYYNGLKADGIAGRATQTNLFENPEMVNNPEVTAAPETPVPATETPEPIATPAITEPPAAIETETVTAETEVPETATEALQTEVLATEEPEITEVPATEEPETTEVPATEEPETTEAPATEKHEVTEAPAAEPEETPVPETTEAPKAEPQEELPEVVENVDLDAKDYEPIAGLVALNEANGPLEYIAIEDGVPVTARPRLSQNGGKIRISLDDLCACVEEWELTDDGVGSVVLEAAGYTLVLYDEDGGSATVDGTAIDVTEEDYDFVNEGHFIDAQFLARALKGEAVWDQEESTLMLRIRDKDTIQSSD